MYCGTPIILNIWCTLHQLSIESSFAVHSPLRQTGIPMRRVYISLQLRHGLQVSFLESDLKTPLRRKLIFLDPAKLIELVERGGGFADYEERMIMEHAIENGRGGIYLRLSDEQYRRLL
jgi:hypothetical protein